MKRAVLFTEKELYYLQHILWHFSDYMAHDDRPDHGLGILKQYREADQDVKSTINFTAGRLKRIYNKWILKQK